MLLPVILRAVMQGALGGEQTYVVRGAVLKCSKGTDPGVLNTTYSHGVYIKDKPVLNVEDAVCGINISAINAFGFCALKGGAPCEPKIAAASKWTGGKEDVLIEEAPALLSDSKLMCSCTGTVVGSALSTSVAEIAAAGSGGIISIIDDGQDL
jgi:hypothetical protein